VAAATCDLCGLPAGREPLSRDFEGSASVFCCLGCLNVYTILSESGLAAGDFRQSELYQQSLRMGLIANAPAATPEIPETAERREALYQLSGLWCSACGWLIEHALRKQRGIVSADVLFTSDLLKLSYCPQYIAAGKIEQTVASLGYRAAPYTGETEPARQEQRDLLLRLGVAAALWMNVMLFSLVIYASYFERISDWAGRAVPVILMALATPVIFYSGWPILRIAWQSVRQRTIRMETLIATGVLAAYVYSVVQIFRVGKHFYFDTACAIVTLVLAGKALEQSAKARTAESLSLLHRLMPKKARVLIGDKEHFVATEAIEPGMILLVKPGERIPADGIVAEGKSSVDESVITGESEPREKSPGDPVVGGSLNAAGILQIRATHPPAESALAQIVRSVEQALASRTQVERTVDRVSRIFVPAVLAIACLTFAGCVAAGVPEMEALMRSIAVLVIACPCALGIATPLATTAAVGAASRLGILLRSPAALESIRKLDVLILDKTGTATEGKFRVQETWWRDPNDLELLAALESLSEHPVARAIVQHAGEQKPLAVANPAVYRGLGIAGHVDGRAILAGSRQLFQSEGLEIAGELAQRADSWEHEGFTVVFCAIDRAFAGMLALGDHPRADAAELVRTLSVEGVRVALISGDSIRTTTRVAEQLGIRELRGEVLPEEKAEIVREYRANGNFVAMAGDGINDAPALAAADLGIAMGSGTDLAMQSAPVVIMGESLMKIVDVMQLARRTNRVIRTNLFWAFGYNLAGISLAVGGKASPILAAGAMVLSSLCVIGNSLTLGRARPVSPL